MNPEPFWSWVRDQCGPTIKLSFELLYHLGKSCTNVSNTDIRNVFFLHPVFVLIRTFVHFDFILSVPLNPSVLHVHSISAVFALLAPHCATALLCYSGLAPVLLLAAIFRGQAPKGVAPIVSVSFLIIIIIIIILLLPPMEVYGSPMDRT